MELRKATENDLKNIMKIIDEAKKFLKNNNVDQWQNGYPNEDVILKDIKSNSSYVLEDSNEIIGTVALSFDGEETYNSIYEGEWLSNGKYAVTHRIAVLNNSDRKGIGTEIIKKSEEICLSQGINNIRIDTHEDNLVMQNLLKKNGFKYCGVIYLIDGSKRIAFEKEI
ncbi:GNAT family N-acetyltransferase [Clostridium sp. AL.422]|uniref:GNAT family N-acetyltransferase n=1 Tax=Clostridium TaxID=1485 RepID=UPI00293DE0C6|nr:MULTISPECIES: GNAT family N-acetyltransferase [unclassified Clostridium]MDV4150519.1 GNAT family N-acetyltransferase [Clostridium sp. AL.422]